jgi:hypothetical protein
LKADVYVETFLIGSATANPADAGASGDQANSFNPTTGGAMFQSLDRAWSIEQLAALPAFEIVRAMTFSWNVKMVQEEFKFVKGDDYKNRLWDLARSMGGPNTQALADEILRSPRGVPHWTLNILKNMATQSTRSDVLLATMLATPGSLMAAQRCVHLMKEKKDNSKLTWLGAPVDPELAGSHTRCVGTYYALQSKQQIEKRVYGEGTMDRFNVEYAFLLSRACSLFTTKESWDVMKSQQQMDLRYNLCCGDRMLSEIMGTVKINRRHTEYLQKQISHRYRYCATCGLPGWGYGEERHPGSEDLQVGLLGNRGILEHLMLVFPPSPHDG